VRGTLVRARAVYARFYFAAAFAMVAEVLILIGLSGALSAALTAEEPTGREMLPTATNWEVWRAVAVELRKQGLSEKQLPPVDGLELPAALPALAGRRLRVASACWDKVPQRTQFRLECVAPGECLPFLVYFRDPVSSNLARHGESCRLSSSHTATATSPKPMVRAGDRATAVFHAARLRMTASVTCLEHGGAGEVIRVRGGDGHVFQARVSGPGELEALPQ